MINTKIKKEFLKSEFKNYPTYKNFSEFRDCMSECSRKCKECGTYYWHDCKKICEHND